MVERSLSYLDNIKLDSLKGFGEKRYSNLKKSNLSSITDLIRFYPRKHIDRSKIKTIKSIKTQNLTSFKFSWFTVISRCIEPYFSL